MLKTKEVNLSDGRVVLVSEITVAQVARFVAAAGSGDFMLKGLDLLYAATGLNVRDLLDLTETDLTNLWDACEEIHAFFFRLARMVDLKTLLPVLITELSRTESTSESSPSPAPAPRPPVKFTPGDTGIFYRLVRGWRK